MEFRDPTDPFRRRTTLSLKFRNKKPRISVFVYKYSNDYQWNEFWWRSKFRIWREYDQMCTKKYHVRNNMMFNGNSIYFWVIRIKIYYVPFYVKMQLNINFHAISSISFCTSAATKFVSKTNRQILFINSEVVFRTS